MEDAMAGDLSTRLTRNEGQGFCREVPLDIPDPYRPDGSTRIKASIIDRDSKTRP